MMLIFFASLTPFSFLFYYQLFSLVVPTSPSMPSLMLLYIISLCYLLHCRNCFVMKWLTFPQAASLTSVNDFLHFPKSLLTTACTQWVLTCYTLVTLSCGLCLQVVSVRLCKARLNNSWQSFVFWSVKCECISLYFFFFVLPLWV